METFTHERIREHLNRLLSTSSFADSAVLTRFLTFIVNETLEGRSRELKEYTIAIQALKKDADFNPQIDSIVRIHAGRLRRALKEYYYEKGKHEAIQIVVPKGSYVPSFITNCSQSLPGLQDENTTLRLPAGREIIDQRKASLAIFPFESITETCTHPLFAKALGIHLSARLTNHPGLSVVSYYSTNHFVEIHADVKEAGAMLNVAYILTGCVQIDKHLRVHILLNACATGEQLRSLTFEKKNIEQIDLFMLQKEIVRKIVEAITGPNGIAAGGENIRFLKHTTDNAQESLLIGNLRP